MGYDTALFVVVDQTESGATTSTTTTTVNENFICEICYGVLEEPTITCRGGHTFCKSCIRKWSRRSNHCPNCRQPILRGNKAILCRNLQSMIMGLQVRCPETYSYSSSSSSNNNNNIRNNHSGQRKSQSTASRRGGGGEESHSSSESSLSEEQQPQATSPSPSPIQCSWVGPLSKYLDEHQNNPEACCFQKKVSCPLCKGMVHWMKLAQHIEHKECSIAKRTVSCPLCNKTNIPYLHLTNHIQNECKHRQGITCPGCNKRNIPVSQFSNHIMNQCPQIDVNFLDNYYKNKKNSKKGGRGGRHGDGRKQRRTNKTTIFFSVLATVILFLYYNMLRQNKRRGVEAAFSSWNNSSSFLDDDIIWKMLDGEGSATTTLGCSLVLLVTTVCFMILECTMWTGGRYSRRIRKEKVD